MINMMGIAMEPDYEQSLEDTEEFREDALENMFFEYFKEYGLGGFEDKEDIDYFLESLPGEYDLFKTAVEVGAGHGLFEKCVRLHDGFIKIEELQGWMESELDRLGFSQKVVKRVAGSFVSALNHYKSYRIGKSTCKQLKEMRRLFAKTNGIDYYEEDCSYDGPCQGTCPYCDAKTKELLEKVEKMQKEKEIEYPFADVAEYSEGNPEYDFECTCEGQLEFPGLGDIEDLELSDHAYHCLKNMGIDTLEELTDLSMKDLKSTEMFREEELEEIRNHLKDFGLALLPDDYFEEM